MKDLLIALYAFVILYQRQSALKEAYTALKNPTLKQFYEGIPSLKDTAAAFMRGDYDCAQLASDLRVFTVLYSKNPDARASITALLRAFATWMRNDSPGAFQQIEKASASTVFPQWVSANFVKELEDQSKVRSTLRSLVKQMTGRPDLGFASPEEGAKAKLKNPDLYQKFLAARKQFNLIWRGFLSNFVRSSGGKTVPYQDVLKAMDKAKVEHMMPLGFEGRIDAAGKWYSQFDEILGGSPPQSNMFPSVRMNPEYTEGSSVWVFIAVRPNGTSGNYGYTISAIKKTVKKKFQAVRDFVPIVDKVRARWVQQIKAFNPESPISVACICLELLYQFSARVGGKAFGIGTLLKKHYAPSVNGFTLKYLGKDSVPTKHVYKASDPFAKLVVKIMAGLAEGKDPGEPLFTFVAANGFRKKVGPPLINAVFTKMGAADITVHKLRTYHGTRIFNEQVAKIYKKHPTVNNPAEAMALLKLAALVVGKELNHVRTTSDGSTKATPATALSAYIDLSAQVEFFRHYNMPLPKHLEGQIVESSLMELDRLSIRSSVRMEATGVIDTKPKKMEEVPEPVNKPKGEDKPEPTDDEEEDSGVIHQLKDLSEGKVGADDLTEEEMDKETTAQEKREERMRKALEDGAEKFSYLLTYGGSDHLDSTPRQGTLDNVLMEDRFATSEAP